MNYDQWKLSSPPEYENDELSIEQKKQLAMTEIEKRLAGIEDLEDELGCFIVATICGGQVDEVKLEDQ